MPDTRTPVEVFCSYAHEDKRWFVKLGTHLSMLQRQKLISTWSDRQISPGTDWMRDIETHLKRASVILLLISPDFLASDFCYSIEMQRALDRHRVGEARVIPILLRPVEKWQAAPFGHLQVLPTDTRFITRCSDKDEAFTEVVAGIRRAIEDLSLLTASLPHTDFPTIWNIPFPRNPFFLGRDNLLAQLRIQLQSGQHAALSQPQAISGLGGIGKTQLAIEYAYRFRQEYQAILWARADSTEALNSSYTAIATLLNLPEKNAQEQSIIIQAVKAWLQKESDWLIILDNADEPDLLMPFLPSTLGGHLVLTTRASALGRLARRIMVETFSVEQGALFLLRRAALLAPDTDLTQALPQDRELASQIAQELGGLPLALDQAGAYLETTGCGLAAYQQHYHQHRTELLQEYHGLSSDHPEPVATAWSLSFQRVEARNSAAADLLRLCAFFAPDAIGEELLAQGADTLGPVLSPVAADGYLLDQAIETLRAYSLIERDARTKTLAIHRLVQAVLRGTLSREDQKQWMQHAMLAINATFPTFEFANWMSCERCLPHALVCVNWIEQTNIASPEAARLLNQAGGYLHGRGRYAEAEPLLQRALTISERGLGPAYPDTATSLNNLAFLYIVQGRYAEAEPLYERVLAIRENVLGPEHPDTQLVRENYALLVQRVGRVGKRTLEHRSSSWPLVFEPFRAGEQ